MCRSPLSGGPIVHAARQLAPTGRPVGGHPSVPDGHGWSADVAQLEQVSRFEQLAQLGVAVVARVERALVGDALPDRADPGPAGVVGSTFDGAAQEGDELGVAAQLVARESGGVSGVAARSVAFSAAASAAFSAAARVAAFLRAVVFFAGGAADAVSRARYETSKERTSGSCNA